MHTIYLDRKSRKDKAQSPARLGEGVVVTSGETVSSLKEYMDG